MHNSHTPAARTLFLLVLFSAAMPGSTACRTQTAFMPEDAPPPTVLPTGQTFHASDFIGATDTAIEGCHAWSGEYTVWVYAAGTRCGVPRGQADRVVVIREPLPGVAPIKAVSTIPGGSYAVWVYGSGSVGHLTLKVCAKFCVIGELPAAPDWALLGWIETRDQQNLLIRPWQLPETRRLDLQALVLSASDTKPDWTP
jgi:hypothetical protein